MKDAPQHPALADEFARWIDCVRVDAPQVLDTLEIHPLLFAGEFGAPYLLLHEALAAKALEVVETHRGNVNSVTARNVGDRAVLILEGESIAGAKQNRVITVDVLIAAGAELNVFVGCVEQGRWDRGAQPFGGVEMAVEPQLRRAARIGSSAAGAPNQRRLWGAVAAKLESSGTDSPSRDYYVHMRRFKERVAEVAKTLTRSADQVGILATEGGRLVGFDVLGHPGNWGKVADRLSHSYVLGSMHGEAELDGVQATHSGAEWLAKIARAKIMPAPTEGLGTRFALEDGSIIGGGLWHEGRPAHVSAFGIGRKPA
jgi:hypothetical protein